MGCYLHDFEKTLAAEFPVDEQELAPPAFIPESEFEFFSRRALEEARLAQQATSPAAANAHRYLAAAYSEQVAKHIKVQAEMEEILSPLA